MEAKYDVLSPATIFLPVVPEIFDEQKNLGIYKKSSFFSFENSTFPQ